MHQGQQECCRGENILEAAIAQDDVKWLMSRQDQKKAHSRTSWEGWTTPGADKSIKPLPRPPEGAVAQILTRRIWAAAMGNYQNDFNKEKDQT